MYVAVANSVELVYLNLIQWHVRLIVTSSTIMRNANGHADCRIYC